MPLPERWRAELCQASSGYRPAPAPKAPITVGRLGPVPLPARFRESVSDPHGLPVPELVLYPT